MLRRSKLDPITVTIMIISFGTSPACFPADKTPWERDGMTFPPSPPSVTDTELSASDPTTSASGIVASGGAVNKAKKFIGKKPRGKRREETN